MIAEDVYANIPVKLAEEIGYWENDIRGMLIDTEEKTELSIALMMHEQITRWGKDPMEVLRDFLDSYRLYINH